MEEPAQENLVTSVCYEKASYWHYELVQCFKMVEQMYTYKLHSLYAVYSHKSKL